MALRQAWNPHIEGVHPAPKKIHAPGSLSEGYRGYGKVHEPGALPYKGLALEKFVHFPRPKGGPRTLLQCLGAKCLGLVGAFGGHRLCVVSFGCVFCWGPSKC